MEMRFAETVRGSGMIFMRLAIKDVPDGVTYTASNTAPDGRALPVELYPFEQLNSRVAAIPVLETPQKVTVRATDGDGGVVCETVKLVKPLAAKLTSRMNTAVKNPSALAIRNSNRRVRAESTTIHVTDAIAGTGDDTILLGRVSIFSMSPEAAHEDLDMVCMDDRGRSCSLKPWTQLSDDVSTPDDYPGTVSRTVQFSVAVPKGQRSVVLWVRGDKGCADGYLCIEPHIMEGMRGGWVFHTLSADRDGDYHRWFSEFARASVRELELQRARRFDVRPVFSVVVPLYKTPVAYFDEMVESVRNQTYGRWELVLVNASPEDDALAERVRHYTGLDDRIKEVRLEGNEGITLNTNKGVEAATGDFVAFFDHDDLLEPDILYHYTAAINDYPDIDMLYCDEDKLVGDRYECPHFKPDWNPDLLMGFNYVTHMLTVRKSLLDELEPVGKEFDGAQDYNMTLRVSERARNIFHVRKVLYHWRSHPASTASSAGAKPYTIKAGLRSLQDHLDRCGIDGVAEEGTAPTWYRVKYHFDEEPLVSIVIPNKDAVPVLSRCLDSIFEKTTYENFEIVVVENNSDRPETFEYYDKISANEKVRVVTADTGGVFNFSKVINYGFAQAKGDYLLMLNNDTEVITPDWIEAMLGICQREDVGAVGTKLLYPNGTIQHAGVVVNRYDPVHLGVLLPAKSTDYFNYLNSTIDLSAVTGACILTKRSVFDAVGGMDESFASDYNDVDFCLKVCEHGLRVAITPWALMYHYESVTREAGSGKKWALQHADARGRLMQRWPKYYALGDPSMSPSFQAGSAYRRLNRW